MKLGASSGFSYYLIINYVGRALTQFKIHFSVNVIYRINARNISVSFSIIHKIRWNNHIFICSNKIPAE